MKTLRIFSFIAILITISQFSFAQSKTETIPVSGNCGMCKKHIEKAAHDAGATSATWNKDTKVLTLRYNSSSTNTAKIQESIAAAGYDTRDIKAPDAAYQKLDACCQYDRESGQKPSCCADAKCVKKDGKCTGTGDCKGTMDCCKNGTCAKKS